jgi:hypothetical protein
VIGWDADVEEGWDGLAADDIADADRMANSGVEIVGVEQVNGGLGLGHAQPSVRKSIVSYSGGVLLFPIRAADALLM